jgi:hypothetical protein
MAKAPKRLLKVERRKPGRPPKDDLLVRELAIAVEVARGIDPQEAHDLALALIEGNHARPTKLPRGYRKAPRIEVGGLQSAATFKGRGPAIARKIKRQDGVRRDVVIALFHLLRVRTTTSFIAFAR